MTRADSNAEKPTYVMTELRNKKKKTLTFWGHQIRFCSYHLAKQRTQESALINADERKTGEERDKKTWSAKGKQPG